MLLSGLSVIKNGVLLGYPFLESIRSAIDICDEFIVVVDPGEDDTLEMLQELQRGEPKLRIIETQWSEKVQPQKCVLAQQTNIGLHQCKGDWALYLQANEVLHQDDLASLKNLLQEHRDNHQVEAMLFERLTFWADYKHLLKVYPDRFKFSPRVVRPHIGTHSIRDAMSFAVFDEWSTKGRYPRAIDTGIDIYRYGKVLSDSAMKVKHANAVHESIRDNNDFFYDEVPAQYIAEFVGEHPQIMSVRVDSSPVSFDSESKSVRTKLSLRERRRLFESAYYRKFGLPKWRNTRYKLIGSYKPKQRGDY